MKVLDKGEVKLLSSQGDDLAIVRAARVLPEVEWRGDADIKLLKYLLKHKHTSPFEQVNFTFYIKAPIFVIRQWHRHRTWSYNEVSGRYKELLDEYYIPELDKIGSQLANNHQGREFGQKHSIGSRQGYIDSCELAFFYYDELIQNGWPRELARCVLPLATYTEMIASVDLHNLLHFINLRSDEHAQWEIQEYSNALKELIKEVVPYTMEIIDGRNTSVE